MDQIKVDDGQTYSEIDVLKLKVEELSEELDSLDNKHKKALISENNEITKKYNHLHDNHVPVKKNLQRAKRKIKTLYKQLKSYSEFIGGHIQCWTAMKEEIDKTLKDFNNVDEEQKS